MAFALDRNCFLFTDGRLIARDHYKRLYPDDGIIAPNRCNQGRVEDCGLVATLNSSLSTPNKAIFIARAVQPLDDSINITLIKDGTESDVNVTEEELNGNGIRNHPACRAIEVAASKITNNGIYSDEFLECIGSNETFYLLTGNHPKTIEVNENSPSVLDELSSKMDDLLIVGLSKPISSFYGAKPFELQTMDAGIVSWRGHKCNRISFDIDKKQVVIADWVRPDKQATITFDEYKRCFPGGISIKTIDGDKVELLFEHYYSILGIDKQGKTVTILNPHSNSSAATISYEDFIKTFGHISFASVSQN